MDIERIKQLIAQREAIDEELKTIVLGTAKRKASSCSKCGSHEHTARNCDQHQTG